MEIEEDADWDSCATRRAEATYYRHWYGFATGLAHELVHALRDQVYYLLRAYNGVTIDFESPQKAGVDAEAGWDWEMRMNGGLLYGAWERHPVTPLTVSAVDDSNLRKELVQDEMESGEPWAIGAMPSGDKGAVKAEYKASAVVEVGIAYSYRPECAL